MGCNRSEWYPRRLDSRNSNSVMIALILLLLLTSCISTEVIDFTPTLVDTTTYKQKAHKEIPTMVEDTTRVPIGFNPTVEDWEETNEQLDF
jgi:hypothetical protein